MLKNVSIGIYFPGKSLLHRLQARTKLVMLMWIAAWLAVASQRVWHFAPDLTVIGLIVLSIALSGISPREIWQRIWLLVLLSVIGAVPTLLYKGNDPRALYVIGPLHLPSTLVHIMLYVIGGLLVVLLFSSWLPIGSLRTLWQQARFKRLRIFCIILLLAVALCLWLTRTITASGSVPIGPFVITYGGTWTIASTFVVLLGLYILSLLLTMTTSPIALVEGLSKLLSPLRLLRLPVDDFVLMALLALRFIPTLLEEVEQLSKAQTARGADISSGTLAERLQSLSMLFMPLMQSVLRRASELATALEARGYQVEGKQTLLHEKAFGLLDYAVMGIIVLVSIGTLLI